MRGLGGAARIAEAVRAADRGDTRSLWGHDQQGARGSGISVLGPGSAGHRAPLAGIPFTDSPHPPLTPPPPADPPLAEWARRIRAGDLAAFEALFRHLNPMLTRLARSIAGTAAEADDAVQEAFARLWEQRGGVDPARSISAYLARSVRNRLLNAARDERTHRELLGEHADALTPPRPDRPDDLAHGASLAGHLRASLDALPERQRTAISLTRFEGLSHAEAAEAMSCSARTVNNHIVRGLRTLRDRLQAYAPDAL